MRNRNSEEMCSLNTFSEKGNTFTHEVSIHITGSSRSRGVKDITRSKEDLEDFSYHSMSGKKLRLRLSPPPSSFTMSGLNLSTTTISVTLLQEEEALQFQN